MLILSTFTSDYLQSPLQYLLKNFSSEAVDVKYTDTNLLIWLTQLHSGEAKNQSIIILFRLIDLIDTSDLKENLNKFIQQVIELKKNKKKPIIVTLCPSLPYRKEFEELENYFLKEMQTNKVHTLSQSDIQQHYALTDVDNKVEYETRIPYIFEFYVALACLITRKFHCITQPTYKVIAVDCDNTLWTGVAGDIGPENIKFEAHNRDLQKFLVKQKENGVLICLCSKNEEETVNKVFSQREGEMILKMSDVALKKINRDAKSNNIKAILSELKLANAKNAMFIDDSEREIDEVSQNLPEIFCVLMPQTIEEFNKTWTFDINEYISVTQTDKDRLKLIQQEEVKSYFSQINDPNESPAERAIKSLRDKRKIPLVLGKIDKKQHAEIRRAEQIKDKTNQFNLFPFSEYPEKEWNLDNLIKNDQIDCFIVTVQNELVSSEEKVENVDRYLVPGDLTALAVCKIYSDHLLVNGFFLSCRNTGLEVEFALAKHIAIYAASKKLDKIKFKFRKTEVNKLAETFIDILCQEINKNFINKKLGEEIFLEFSTHALAQLDPYLMMRKTIEANAVNNNIPSERLINSKDLENAKKYLPLLQEATKTIQPLVEKFLTGSQETNDLAEMLIDQLKFLTSDKAATKTLDILQHTPLVHLGLSSLNATILSGYIYQKLKIKVSIDILFRPEMTVSVLLDYINQQKGQKNILDNTLTEWESKLSCSSLVSMQQQRIWNAEQQEGVINSSNYHMIACFSITELNIDCFKQACQQLIEHYDVFGTSFSVSKGQLKKSIISSTDRKLSFESKKLSDESELLPAIHREISQPLSMLSASLIRFVIFEVKSDKKYHIFFHVHHCIFDAFSLNICTDILSKLYKNILDSTSLKIITAPSYNAPSYNDFIYEQNKKFFDKHFQLEAEKYWSQHLSILEEIVEISCDQPTSGFKPTTEQKANRYEFQTSAHDFTKLSQLARSIGVTRYSIISSVLSILISAYAFKEKLAIVTATSGREPPFIDTVGFFVNLLVQVFDLKENKTFINFVIENHKNLINGIQFQDYPFSEIQKILQKRDIYNPLQNTALVYQSYASPKLILNGENARLSIPKKSILLDMREYCRFGTFTLFAQEQEDQQALAFIIEYADSFSEAFIKNIAENFLHIIDNVCKNPNQKLRDISVICDEEQSKLISLGQGPQLNYAEEDNLVRRFQGRAKEHPGDIALYYGKTNLTYGGMDQQSTNLAQALINKGVHQGDKVGICLEAKHLFFIAELAVLKIGSVFIPLSQEDPPKRLNSIINDANIKFIIVDDKTEGRLLETGFQARQLVYIDSTKSQDLADSLPLFTTNMEDSTCILYTSGSTGVPKGVVIPQKALFRVIISLPYEIQPQDKIAQTANQVFDAAQLEFFLAFLNGASLVIFDKDVLLDKKLFTKEILDKKVSVMWLTAGLFNLYALQSPEIFKLKFLMSGGDVVDKKAVDQVLSANPNLQFMNGYGPTETGIFALTYTPNRENLKEFSTMPIGKPTIAGTQIFILNVFNGLAPLGAIGQLGISGEGLGAYHNNEILQKKCFLPYPENLKIKLLLAREKLAARVYMSGDKVQFRKNEILFLGRMNEEQIKIRGNLVALAEIKVALEEHLAIRQAEILYEEISDKNKALVVYYTKNEESLKPKKAELIQFLKTKLSPVMIPIYYEKIKEFPLTANGKLDRVALSKLPLTINEESDSDKENIPENLKKIQENLLLIFKDILPYPTLEDSFFDLGGDSIKAIQLLAKIEESFDKRISFNILRQNPTIQSLSYVLERDESLEHDLLSLLHKGTDEKLPPIIFIHPAGGGLFCFNKLIDALKTAQLPNYCYGIEDPVILDRQVKTLTIPEMAKNYNERISKKFKGTAYIPVGYSFGGMVALEIAAQLEALNQNCLGVILLDTWVVSRADEKLKAALRSHVLEYCEKVIQNVSINQNIEKVESLIHPMMEQCKYYQQIGFEFVPEELFSTSVTLFKANDIDGIFEGMERKTQCNYLENFIKSKNLATHMVEGNHFNLLEENANLAFLAKKFVKYVEKISQCIPDVNIRPTTFFQTTVNQDMNVKKTVVSKQVLGLRN
jgi:amino acid adenylation domain-containing protein/FkbH-like protein